MEVKKIMEEENNATITIKKSDFWKYSTLFLLLVVVIGGFMLMKGNDGTTTGTVTGNVVDAGTQPSVVKASLDDDAVLGKKDAPVTIVEFSDYQCPFCRKFWTETLPQLKSTYIDTGKVKLVFRDLPLASLHPMAQASAEAAECVKEKGGDTAYFKFHDKLFEEQNIIDSGSATGAVTKTAVYTNDDFKSWAKETGYDIASCLDSGKYKNEVLKDVSDAQAAGFQGTQGFLIMKSGESSGTPLKGAYPIDSFKQIIDGLSA